MSASDCHCPVASARYWRPDAAYRPTGASTFVEPSAVATSPTVRPERRAAPDRPRLRTSRVSLADTSRRPDARRPRQRRPHHVERVVVEVRNRQRAGDVQAEDGEGRRREPLDGELGVLRQLLADLVDEGLHLLQRHDHVGRRRRSTRRFPTRRGTSATARGGCRASTSRPARAAA